MRLTTPTPTTPAASTTRHTTAPRASVRFSRPRRARGPVVIAASVAVVLVAGASTVHAEPTHVLAIAGSIDEVLTNIRNWIMGILAGIATVFLSIGGVRWVIGSSDPGEVERSKHAFKAAAIGYGLAALAPLVVTILKGIVGQS